MKNFPLLPSSQARPHSWILFCQQHREWGFWSIHHIWCLLLFPLQKGGLLTLFPCHKRQSCIKFPNMGPSTSYSSSLDAPAWMPPMGCIPSGTECSSMWPSLGQNPHQHELLSPQDHRFCQKRAPVWASHGV